MAQPQMSKTREEEARELRNTYSKLNKKSRCKLYSKNRNIPNAYKENTLKEELILEHVIQYRKEFSQMIDPNRELFLYPKNEVGKYKFICTTIRPTKVPYPELYDYDKCAKFLADFLEYEELNPPNALPEYLPAPDNVVAWQIGDCFDYSIVLCSLLIGAGYNAYVVYGISPRYIATKDERNLECPDLTDDVKLIEVDLSEKAEDLDIKTYNYRVPIESAFDKKEIAEKEAKIKERWIEENVINDDQPELERFDPWEHRRLHCCVLLKKNKRIDHDIFIEPITGRLYTLEKPPFEKIEAVFNNFNFWINLQPEKDAKEVDLNLLNKSIWEYVMLNLKDSNDDQEEIDDDEFENNKEDYDLDKMLDMPPPWPNKIHISGWAYHNRVPLATQTFYYKKTKVDKFAVYSQNDGKVMMIYKYNDFARCILNELEIRYRNRVDKLYKRIRRPYDHKIIDYYLPGQEYGWKVIEELEAEYRKIWYYETNFSTGLVYREEIFGQKIIHHYKSRDDRVYERTVLLEETEHDFKVGTKQYELESALYPNRLLVVQLTEKYGTNPLVPVRFYIIYSLKPRSTVLSTTSKTLKTTR